MVKGKRVVVVLPAYNAEKTLARTYEEIPHGIVDEVVIVDDYSRDSTLKEAKRLGIEHIIAHPINKGYGANQKTCYDKALSLRADIIVMLHPDYQYTPKLIEAICFVIANEVYHVVMGSRILGKGALKGGMPFYKYFFNRMLTYTQNLLMNQKLSEYHSGYRGFSTKVLNDIPYHLNSDSFIFDNQILAQVFNHGYEIGEISCPTNYFKEASSINLKESFRYGMGVLGVSILYLLKRIKVYNHYIFTHRSSI